jgi:hypothetical protein
MTMGIPLFGGDSALSWALTAKAHDKLRDGHDIVGNGDLCQMMAQAEALRNGGFDVGRRDVYPTVPAKDRERAVRFLWERRVEGWWNLEHDLVPKIISQEEFDLALGRKKA